MSRKLGSWIRLIALYTMIAFDGGALGWSVYLGKTSDTPYPWVMFWFLSGINVTVVIAEILSVIFTGRTISSNFKYWAREVGWKAYVWLFLFLGSIIALGVHLAVIFA